MTSSRTQRGTQRRCMLVASKAVTYRNPQLPSLQHVLTTALNGVAPTPAQVQYMAWWLGCWLADGISREASVSQGGAPPPDPHHHWDIFAELRRYTQLFGEPVGKRQYTVSSAGHPAYYFEYGLRSVAGLVPALIRSAEQQARAAGSPSATPSTCGSGCWLA